MEEIGPYLKAFLMYRHIDPERDVVCPHCNGAGVRVYPDTSTWHHRAGGQQPTADICDACWGSGAINRKWADLRNLIDRTDFLTEIADALTGDSVLDPDYAEALRAVMGYLMGRRPHILGD